MGKNIQIYLDVNSKGEIISAQKGENIVPSDVFHYFFLKEEVIADNLEKYKVVIVNMVPQLILKDAN